MKSGNPEGDFRVLVPDNLYWESRPVGGFPNESAWVSRLCDCVETQALAIRLSQGALIISVVLINIARLGIQKQGFDHRITSGVNCR